MNQEYEWSCLTASDETQSRFGETHKSEFPALLRVVLINHGAENSSPDVVVGLLFCGEEFVLEDNLGKGLLKDVLDL